MFAAASTRFKPLTLNSVYVNIGAKSVHNIKFEHVRTICILPVSSVVRPSSVKTSESVRQICTSHPLMKVKNKGKKKVQHIDLRELGEVFNTEKLMAEFRGPVDRLRENFIKQVSLRSSIGALEELSIKYEGKEYQLQELVQISRKPKLVVLNAVAHPQSTSAIIDALRKSRLNLNPQQEKTTIYIPIPKITKEHREKLAKTAKALFHQSRDKLGDIQTHYIKQIKKREDLSIPTCQRLQEYLDIIRHQHIDEAQQLLEAKEKELLRETD